MAKILCPNNQYTGISASVAFINGIGETDNLHLIEWFKNHGYTVESEIEQNDDQQDDQQDEDAVTKTKRKYQKAETKE